MPRNKKRRRNPQAASASVAGQRQGQPVPPTQAAAVRREAQRQVRTQAAKREDRRIWLYVGGGAAAVVALIVVLIVINLGGPSGPGQRISSEGRAHLTVGQTFTDYRSDPPTSGPHSPSPMPRGFYTDGAPDERLVHSLEHAYVIINYNCNDDECPETIDQISRVYARYDSKLIANFRPQTEARIALTAWTRLETMEEFDEQRATEFIEVYRGKIGPEPNAP